MSDLLEAKRDEKTLTISIPIENMKFEEIEDLLASIKAEVITRRSRLTEAQAFQLGEEVKASWWRDNGERIKRMIAENESNNRR